MSTRAERLASVEEPLGRNTHIGAAMDCLEGLLGGETFHGFRSEVWGVLGGVWDAADSNAKKAADAIDENMAKLKRLEPGAKIILASGEEAFFKGKYFVATVYVAGREFEYEVFLPWAKQAVLSGATVQLPGEAL